MACNCKVKADIQYLNKQYGVGPSKKTNIRGSVKTFFKKVFVGALVILAIPFMIIMILFNIARGKKVTKIEELFKFKNVRQQNIQDKNRAGTR